MQQTARPKQSLAWAGSSEGFLLLVIVCYVVPVGLFAGGRTGGLPPVGSRKMR
jgi:hypothetical protein